MAEEIDQKLRKEVEKRQVAQREKGSWVKNEEAVATKWREGSLRKWIEEKSSTRFNELCTFAPSQLFNQPASQSNSKVNNSGSGNQWLVLKMQAVRREGRCYWTDHKLSQPILETIHGFHLAWFSLEFVRPQIATRSCNPFSLAVIA